MFRKSHAEEFIESLGAIKTYKRFKQEKRYTGKKAKQLEQTMTLHHLQHRSESGSTSAENGAIINELAHRYIHSLPRNQEEIINDYIREWKKQNYTRCEVQIEELPEQDFEIDISEIEIADKIKIKPLTRAQIKVQTRKAYEEYLNERED